MGIVYHENSSEFHLYNNEISYIIKVLDNKQLGQLYYGKRIRDRESFGHLLELGQRDMACCTFDGNSVFSLEHIKQEYPAYGSGDVRYPAYEIEDKNGSRISDFKYKQHCIFAGKPGLHGLPSTYVENLDEAVTLKITLEDSVIQTELVLTYTIYENIPVITRNARFACSNPQGITLNSAMSFVVDFPDSNFDMVDLPGAWGRERGISIHRLHCGIQGVYSMRGCSSHQFNPFIALKRPNTDEFTGEVYGFSLVYSGSFIAQAEVNNYDVTRVLMGIHPNGFCWHLSAGDSFQTPEAVMVYSDQGLNRMSQTYHELYRTRLARGKWRDLPRPILINNWEATYFDFNEEKILNIAGTAKRLGVELFVLDDGWFGKRNDATSSLGDWFPNYQKLPKGVKHLGDKITELGMKFGLWIEPEMVNKDSNLYRAHPDWVLGASDRKLCHSRNQLILDFSKEEVVDYIGDSIEKILCEAPISYVKWDMNRSMSEVFSRGEDAKRQGKVVHSYILGVYKLYERLTTEFPDILFESCASGGARFDPGMLYYAPQGWISDDTDAVERLKIQYGTSYVYPLSSMGSHVSAAPNHQVFRNTPLETRANVAYFGTFGYELDLNNISAEEMQIVSEQVKFMKKHRELIQKGLFYRLLSPFENNDTAWMVVSKDKKHALVGYYRVLQPVNVGYKRLKLKGLREDCIYSVSMRKINYYGDELMNSGLDISDKASGVRDPYTALGQTAQGDYYSCLFLIEAQEE